ncbi:hypothetical protein Z043_116577 [Scleropages formosus]|nr:hypothetical protein Z043_116577 [Scleropages formosus]
MATAILSISEEKRHSALFIWVTRLWLWTLSYAFVVLVCMSRVYVAAHFPHQVIGGVIAGITVAKMFSRAGWIYKASLKKYFCTTLCLLTSALGFYLLLKMLGVDLLWTLEKANMWCTRAEWVHMDTSPFASLLRNMGILLGLGLGLHSPLYVESRKSKSAPFSLSCVIASLTLLQLLDTLSFSSNNPVVFYSLSFFKSTVMPFITIALVPASLSVLFRSRRDQKML